MLKELKEFAMKGNVVDMAIGVIIGGAFGKIVTSLVSDLIMPLISVFTGGLDFANKFFSLDGNTYLTLAEAQKANAATINYGLFITTIIDFIIIALSIFLVIKQLAKLKKEEPIVEEAPTTKNCPYCFTAIAIEATRCPNCTSNLE